MSDVKEDAVFQSTPLREGRPIKVLQNLFLSYFNPRPCVRGDELIFLFKRVSIISIHAPA